MGKNNKPRKPNCTYCDQPRQGNHNLCAMHRRLYMEEYRNKVRKDTLGHYSNNTYVCAICGTIKHLEIDHINGGGNKERKELNKPAGWHFYEYLRSQGYPAGYRVLCKACNSLAHIMTDDEIREHYKNAAIRITAQENISSPVN